MHGRESGNPENSHVADAEYYKSMVSISGDVMVAGSPWEKITEHCDAGAAYVYAREASADGTSYSWTHIQKITATDASKWDHDPDDSSNTRKHPTKNFGHAVAVDGDTMVISYQFGRNVRVYTRSDAGNPKSLWTLRAKLAVPSLTHDDTTPVYMVGGLRVRGRDRRRHHRGGSAGRARGNRQRRRSAKTQRRGARVHARPSRRFDVILALRLEALHRHLQRSIVRD